MAAVAGAVAVAGEHCRQAGAMAEAEAEAVTLSATIPQRSKRSQSVDGKRFRDGLVADVPATKLPRNPPTAALLMSTATSPTSSPICVCVCVCVEVEVQEEEAGSVGGATAETGN